MGGYFPGPMGAAAFAGVKLGGYTLAGVALRRLYPAATAGAFRIAITRTLAGLAIGISHIVLWGTLLGRYFSDSWFLLGLLVLRLIVWTLVIWFFCDRQWERPRRILACALAGTAFSFLLDVIGIALALTTPGKIPVC